MNKKITNTEKEDKKILTHITKCKACGSTMSPFCYTCHLWDTDKQLKPNTNDQSQNT